MLKLHPTTDCASVLDKVKSWLLEAAEQDKNKTHNENNMATFDKICSNDNINVT